MDLHYWRNFCRKVNFSPVFGKALDKSGLYLLDLSKGNQDLKSLNGAFINGLGEWLECQVPQGKIAYGGYLEDRAIYQDSEDFSTEAGSRSIHLGIDFWLSENTPLFCPWDATVYGKDCIDSRGNYGGVIILAHKGDETGQRFYSLYGHLSHRSVDQVAYGQKIEKGEQFAELGKPSENGYWPPHLHLQVILDMLDFKDDFPGVASRNEMEKYMRICPDPSPLVFGE